MTYRPQQWFAHVCPFFRHKSVPLPEKQLGPLISIDPPRPGRVHLIKTSQSSGLSLLMDGMTGDGSHGGSVLPICIRWEKAKLGQLSMDFGVLSGAAVRLSGNNLCWPCFLAFPQWSQGRGTLDEAGHMGLWCVLCGDPDPVPFVLTSVVMLILKLCLVCKSWVDSPCRIPGATLWSRGWLSRGASQVSLGTAMCSLLYRKAFDLFFFPPSLWALTWERKGHSWRVWSKIHFHFTSRIWTKHLQMGSV